MSYPHLCHRMFLLISSSLSSPLQVRTTERMPKPTKATESDCTKCSRSIATADPHTECMTHNSSCFTNLHYAPSKCQACLQLIEAIKSHDQEAVNIFGNRYENMKKAVQRAIIKKKTAPDDVIARYYNSGGKDVYCSTDRHLDPRRKTPLASSCEPFFTRPCHHSYPFHLHCRPRLPAAGYDLSLRGKVG